MTKSTRLGTAALLAAFLLAPALTSAPHAQTSTTTPGMTTAPGTGAMQVNRGLDDDGFDWGWIGLLGLAGLAPLFMRKDRHGNVHADTRR